MSVVTSRESVDRAVQDLEAAVERAQPIESASVSRIYQTADRWSVGVTIESPRTSIALRPRFSSWLEAHSFRTAACEIVTAAS